MIASSSNLLERALESLSGKFNVVDLPVHDCPVFLAAAFPTQPHVTGLKPRLPAGRGFTREQALLSAAAEASELLATLATPDEPSIHEDGNARVNTICLNDGARVSVLAQEVYLDWAVRHGEVLSHDADSSGCAAGQNMEDATTRALYECVERDAFAIWWYGRQSRRHMPLSYIDRLHPRLAWWLDNRHRRCVFIDITSDLDIPAYAAVSCDPDGSAIAIGTAAGGQTSSALISAVTEMIQTEISMEIGASPDNHDLSAWCSSANFHEMKQFSAITGFAQERLLGGAVDAQLKNKNVSMLRADLTVADEPFAIARMILPGLCKMNNGIIAERILQNSRLHPEFGGVTQEHEFEKIEPY